MAIILKFAARMGLRGKTLENKTIEKIAAEGKCIAKHADLVVFVDKVAPGDVVDIKITRKKKNYLEGTPIAFHHFADIRTEPFCQHFGTCGGCKWQHLPYEKQIEYKQQQVVDHFTRIGKLDFPSINPILASPDTRFYRNKLEFTFTNRRWLTEEEIKSEEDINRDGLGFHMPGRFDRLLDVTTCYLQPDPSNQIREAVKNFARQNDFSFYDILEQKGFLRNLIIRNTMAGDVMVILQVAENNQEQIFSLLEMLKQYFPSIVSFYYVVNHKKNETFFDQDLILYHGQSHLIEEMDGVKFRIGPKSFFQTNSRQALNLYRIAADYAALNGSEIVYDLYTGTGTIANYVAGKAKKVVGVETIPEAIEDAEENARINKIDNASFYAGTTEELFAPELIAKHGKPDVVITDPPRAGMHAKAIEQLRQTRPQLIVYVSCNPATQARDLALLADLYTIEAVQPVDMFPHTHHVENVVKLKLNIDN
jgi:23S rRNA (uracil1939-C5)-methyltransferase